MHQGVATARVRRTADRRSHQHSDLRPAQGLKLVAFLLVASNRTVVRAAAIGPGASTTVVAIAARTRYRARGEQALVRS